MLRRSSTAALRSASRDSSMRCAPNRPSMGFSNLTNNDSLIVLDATLRSSASAERATLASEPADRGVENV